MNKIINVEKTFYSKQEELSSVEEKLKRFKDFYVWLQKQYPKGEDYESERQALLQVEYRLYWHCLKEVFEASKQGEKIMFNKLADNWDTSLSKFLYEFIDWYKSTVTKRGGLMAVSNEVQQSYATSMAKIVKAAQQADFYQMMYINMQLQINDMMDFKYLAYPPKKKAGEKQTSSDEPFLGSDNELFKSDDMQPIFWHCLAKKQVTIQDCIDEDLDLLYLCWPRGSAGHQDFTAVLPPMSYTKTTGYDMHWSKTYKGQTLREINEAILAKQPKQETKQLNAKEAEEALDGIDVSWLVSEGDEDVVHPKVVKKIKETPSNDVDDAWVADVMRLLKDKYNAPNWKYEGCESSFKTLRKAGEDAETFAKRVANDAL